MQVEIKDISYGGCGVGKVDGKVIFVPHTDIGEIVEVNNVSKGSKFDKGEIVSVIKPSEDRCEPFCPYFSLCGGCDFQFVNYERELELKLIILKNELKKANFLEKIEIFSSKNRFFYRNKIKLTYRNNKLGYITPSKNFISIDKCPIANVEINEALAVLNNYFKVHSYKNLKSVTFRKSDDKILVAFLFSQKENFVYDEILNPFFIGVFVGEVLENDKTKLIKTFNSDKFYKTILNVKIPIDFKSFFQINDLVAENLYGYIIDNLKGRKIVNAYSGQGALSLYLSTVCKKVVGIEIQKSSHLIAEEIKNSNMENINGLVEEKLPLLLKEEKFDAIVLDPARAGCQKSVIESINRVKIKEIYYISCNFATLARDLKLLSEVYHIENVKMFDMFPCTANMEVCAHLTLKSV